MNRGRHLYSAGRPSRWALAHISRFTGVAALPQSHCIAEQSFTARRRADILLNVFLAIAVDNLGDADEANEEAAREAELTAAAAAAVAAETQVASYRFPCCVLLGL